MEKIFLFKIQFNSIKKWQTKTIINENYKCVNFSNVNTNIMYTVGETINFLTGYNYNLYTAIKNLKTRV